jgi:hypothetical protein
MRRFVIISTIAAAVAMSVGIAGASANRPDWRRLDAQGWDCPVVFDAVHCAPPGGLARVVSGEAETMTFLVFSTSDGSFLGTELIVRADIFKGQPCPTDPPSRRYTPLFEGEHNIGLNYYACHRYDSPF